MKPQLRDSFFPDKVRDLRLIKDEYLHTETRLLNSYQHLLTQKVQKEQEALRSSSQVIAQITKYLTEEKPNGEGAIWSTMGFEIMNEDEQCEQIKMQLVSLDRAQYLLKHSLNKGKGEQSEGNTSMRQLEFLRKCLEWMLQVFEGSMDEKILESILDKMDYNQTAPESITKNISKVNELLAEVEKYNKQLKKITKSIQLRDK